MVKIRLAKQGKKNNPFYRVVATDEKNKNSGKFLKILGYWHPQSNLLKLEKEEISKFVAKGAQVSDAVKKLLDTK